MDLTLSPKIERRITEQISSGRFPTAEAVIEAAIVEFTEEEHDESFDDEDVAAIREAQAEIERGEGMSLAEFDAEMAKLAGRP